MKPAPLELVSFALCPYVQRAVITLQEKKVDYRITYIDLENPPAWFEEISPLGQVPVLRITRENGEVVSIFESMVICELLDETVGKPLHPADPIDKARERSWIEYGSGLFKALYLLTYEEDATRMQALRKEFFEDLARYEDQVRGPYFRGDRFGLVDAALAPLFMRLALTDPLRDDPAWKALPKTRAWSRALLELPSVRSSVREGFAEEYRAYLGRIDSALLKSA